MNCFSERKKKHHGTQWCHIYNVREQESDNKGSERTRRHSLLRPVIITQTQSSVAFKHSAPQWLPGAGNSQWPYMGLPLPEHWKLASKQVNCNSALCGFSLSQCGSVLVCAETRSLVNQIMWKPRSHWIWLCGNWVALFKVACTKIFWILLSFYIVFTFFIKFFSCVLCRWGLLV